MKSTRVIRYLFLALLALAIPASSLAGVFISVGIAPPPLPVYVQPACPGDGYIWTPGYWAYGPDGYYWVPGTWVMAPEPGFLWTPGYWGWGGGAYVWHAGYWGPHIGFYGGINYGFGYFGTGYEGGYWRDRHFYYNRSVNNVTITNVHIYNKTVNNITVNRVAYNGGHGGINARPSHFEEVAVHERHFEPTRTQLEHEHGARSNRAFLASENHGRPAIAATARPGEFNNHGLRGENRGGGSFRPSENRGPENRAAENRGVPRPGNNARNNDRPMMRQDTRQDRRQDMARQDVIRQESRNNRGEQQMRNAPRQEVRQHNDPGPRSNSNAPRPENARPHENGVGQRQSGNDHGHGPR
jgi:hypothetical protein